MAKRKCRPTKYATATLRGKLTYGFRCAFCGVESQRFATEQVRDERVREHIAAAKKLAKKS